MGGGSPATDQIEGGIESSELQPNVPNVPGQVEKESNVNEPATNDHLVKKLMRQQMI